LRSESDRSGLPRVRKLLAQRLHLLRQRRVGLPKLLDAILEGFRRFGHLSLLLSHKAPDGFRRGLGVLLLQIGFGCIELVARIIGRAGLVRSARGARQRDP
jgi:hypothetical protein